jgi:hypothetical protein
MKKFNLMFNSNSHPIFYLRLPSHYCSQRWSVIRFSIYVITNISECDFYGSLRGFKDQNNGMSRVELNGIFLDFFPLFYCVCDSKSKKFVTMKNLSIRDNCNPINSFSEFLQCTTKCIRLSELYGRQKVKSFSLLFLGKKFL